MSDTLAVGRINASIYLTPHPTASLDPLPALLELINGAKHTLTFAAYSFTSKPIADAITAAHQRGVTVIGVADITQAGNPSSLIPAMQAAGVDIKLWGSQWQLAHDKAFVADGATRNAAVSLGSYNDTAQAERNNLEVLLVASGSQVAKVLAPAIEQQIKTARTPRPSTAHS